jgi:hypothetical protein
MSPDNWNQECVAFKSDVHDLHFRLIRVQELWHRSSKIIPATGCGGPFACETSRFPHFSRQSANRWRWCCQLYEPATLYSNYYPWKSFLLEVESTSSPQGVWKDQLNWNIQSVTSEEIEPATFRLIAQCLNQLHYRQPYSTQHPKYIVNYKVHLASEWCICERYFTNQKTCCLSKENVQVRSSIQIFVTNLIFTVKGC